MKQIFVFMLCMVTFFSCSKKDSTNEQRPILIDRGIDSFELVLSPIIAPDAQDKYTAYASLSKKKVMLRSATATIANEIDFVYSINGNANPLRGADLTSAAIFYDNNKTFMPFTAPFTNTKFYFIPFLLSSRTFTDLNGNASYLTINSNEFDAITGIDQMKDIVTRSTADPFNKSSSYSFDIIANKVFREQIFGVVDESGRAAFIRVRQDESPFNTRIWVKRVKQ
jgi:hypothetical protein